MRQDSIRSGWENDFSSEISYEISSSSPQIIDLVVAIENVIRIARRAARRSLSHNSVDCRIDARRLHPVSMHSIMVADQVAVSDEGPPAQVALVVLTWRRNSWVVGKLIEEMIYRQSEFVCE